MEVNLCIPTLNRYDLLARTIESAENGTLKPTRYYIIDNGKGLNIDLSDVVKDRRISLCSPGYNLGLAKSWNLFIETVKEIRIICNDDIYFFPDSIEELVNNYDENYITYPGSMNNKNSFSCFILPNKIVENNGKFDEKISPQYGYFEDNDYYYRLLRCGFDLKEIPTCRVEHIGSATLKGYSKEEQENHHKKFRLAQANYIRKWGGLPGKEIFPFPSEL